VFLVSKKAILISGTPGTGKTCLSLELGKKLSLNVLNIGDFAIKNNLIIEKDNNRDTLITKTKKIVPKLKKIILNSDKKLIIESHYADIIPTDLVDIIIILRTHPYILEKRLKMKNYSQEKINENVAAEILGICTNYALNKYPKNIIFELDTSEVKINEAVEILNRIITLRPDKYKFGFVNWMKDLEKNKDLEKYFR